MSPATPPTKPTSSCATGWRAPPSVSVATGGAEANHASGRAAISADGRFVAFASYATDLVPGVRGSGSELRLFVRDLLRRRTELVSVGPTGRPEFLSGVGLVERKPSIPGGGRTVAFDSSSALVRGDANGANDVFVRDRAFRVAELISVGPGRAQGNGHSFGLAVS